jgi:hypothetical protein
MDTNCRDPHHVYSRWARDSDGSAMMAIMLKSRGKMPVLPRKVLVNKENVHSLCLLYNFSKCRCGFRPDYANAQ